MSASRGGAADRLRAAVLAREAEILERCQAFLSAHLPSYAGTAEADIAVSLRQNIEMCLAAADSASTPAVPVLRRYSRIAEGRMARGIPVEDVMRSYRFAMSEIADVLVEALPGAAAHGTVPSPLELYRRIWAVSDTYTGLLVHRYRQSRAQQERVHREACHAALLALRQGETGSAAALLPRDSAALCGFCVRRAHGTPAGDVHEVLLAVEDRLGARGIAAVSGDRVLGVSTAPMGRIPGEIVTTGPWGQLEDMPMSLVAAESLAVTSLARPGEVLTPERASWRGGLAGEPWLRRQLEDEFVMPLAHARGGAAALLDTVRAVQGAGGDVTAAAHELSCHRNTVRYRLRRFEELTDAVLTEVETQVRLAVLFELRDRGEG
ncbi:helix-turn-helix domain-containing protein [Brevibacterium album]|uniref:helix-turn-helix domain-containing protein n=1 Tax=Brevibacterium album TaxID=417948 RepID=UPI00040376DE|nr:helix-turn-helix domain-containing protein [Brevibacterium album]